MPNRSELTQDEVDAVMANIHPASRRWCIASCGPRPGIDVGELPFFGCACTGCISGALSWEDFAAWEAREALGEPTPYIDFPDPPPPPPPPTLQERLAAYKAGKIKGT